MCLESKDTRYTRGLHQGASVRLVLSQGSNGMQNTSDKNSPVELPAVRPESPRTLESLLAAQAAARKAIAESNLPAPDKVSEAWLARHGHI